MLILALDTASRGMSLSILNYKRVLVEIALTTDRQHGETTLAAIEAALSLTEIALSDIELLACTVGPGSFTGLRVGIGSVKGLAFAHNKPVVAVSSLDALAMNVREENMPICAMLDARRGELYAACYEPRSGEIPQRVGEEMVITPQALIDKIDGKMCFVGEGAVAYADYFKETLAEKIHFAGPADNNIRASAVGVIGLKKYESGDRLSALTVMPHYLRSSYAEGGQRE